MLRAEELPKVKVNQSPKYFQPSDSGGMSGGRNLEEDLSSHENGMSEREIHFLQEKGYTFTRRKTVNLIHGEHQERLLQHNVDGHIWTQRRETSGIIMMKEVPSRKTLTTTDQSKKQLQEIVIPDPN